MGKKPANERYELRVIGVKSQLLTKHVDCSLDENNKCRRFKD